MKKFGWLILFFVFAAILSLPSLLTKPYWCNWKGFDFSETGQIGDTIGGITAPFIGLTSAVLVYLALIQQIKSTEKISENENYKDLMGLLDRWISYVRSLENKSKFLPIEASGVFDSTVIDLGQWTKFPDERKELNEEDIKKYSILMSRYTNEINRVIRAIKFATSEINDKQKLLLICSELKYINDTVVAVSIENIINYLNSDFFFELPFLKQIHVTYILSIFKLQILEMQLAQKLKTPKELKTNNISAMYSSQYKFLKEFLANERFKEHHSWIIS